MKLPKTKTIIKYAVIAYLLYLAYSLPKADWDKGETLTETDDAGKVTRYVPKQSSYIKYLIAWWRITVKTKGAKGIIDEYLLSRLGINLDE